MLLTVTASARARSANGCGPCSLVATIRHGSTTVLLQGTAASTPPARSQTSPFRPTDHLTWRLTFRHLTARVSRATVRLGTPNAPGRYLFTLCRRCRSDAHGQMPLGTGLARVLTAGVTCHQHCPPAASWPLGASIDVLLTDAARTRLAGTLRFCAPNQYRHRNSCSPPGF